MGWMVLSDPELLLNLSVSVVSLLVAGGVLTPPASPST
jgi:hypothetical protein